MTTADAFRMLIAGLLAGFFFTTVAKANYLPNTYTLTDCMNMRYGAGNWTQRQAAHVGTDIGPALEACFSEFRQMPGGRGMVYVDPGIWRMVNGPHHTLLAGNRIEGAVNNEMASMIVYDNTGPGGRVAFHFSGAGGFSGGGISNIALMIEAGLGNSTAYGIYLSGDANSQPDQTRFENIYMSTMDNNSRWYNNLLIYGGARPNLLMRVVTFRNMQLFNSHAVALYMDYATFVEMTGVGCWTYTGAPRIVGANVSNVQANAPFSC